MSGFQKTIAVRRRQALETWKQADADALIQEFYASGQVNRSLQGPLDSAHVHGRSIYGTVDGKRVSTDRTSYRGS